MSHLGQHSPPPQPLMANRTNPIRRIDSLYGRCLALVEREIKHLETMSIVEKLPSGFSKDLRDFIKLLAEIKTATKEIQEAKTAKATATTKTADETLLSKIANAEEATKDN